MAESQKCENCRYWIAGNGGAAACHQAAPVAVPWIAGRGALADYWNSSAQIVGVEARAVWPVTQPSDWCGQWRAREAIG